MAARRVPRVMADRNGGDVSGVVVREAARAAVARRVADRRLRSGI
jgi:hypothetical protein